ncbi:MAG: NAD(P)H-hydrate dehydratase [Candidatus Coatesbacteria bacterium]|nr:NAD(P)H-hydrate dehydratase [Candidatus Coatesbacteria bacterium]
MKPVHLPESMKDIDKKTIEGLGVESKCLMEMAGYSIYKEILSEKGNVDSENIAIFCGTGNNGGDGFVVARWLSFRKPKDLNIYVMGNEEKFTQDARYNYELAKKLGIKILFLDEELGFDYLPFDDFTIIIDALLGTGVKGSLRSSFCLLLGQINNTNAWKIAVDMPTGINGEEGAVSDAVFNADMTVTMGALKIPLILPPAREYAGKIKIADIGFPEKFLKDTPFSLFESDDVAIPKRSPQAHKYSVGKIAIFAGSSTYSGAAVLTASAALQSGCGMVRLFVPDCIESICKSFNPSLLVHGLHSTNGTFDGKSISDIELEHYDSIIAGPGLTVSTETEYFLNDVLSLASCPLVIDADALNLVAASNDLRELLKKKDYKRLLTPHRGEFRKLLAKDEISIIRDIQDLSSELDAIILLKGMPTMLANKDGKIIFTEAGNQGMATAGSGDVLAGLLGSFIAQFGFSEKVIAESIYIHGHAGNMAASELGMLGITSSDILDFLSKSIKEIAGW